MNNSDRDVQFPPRRSMSRRAADTIRALLAVHETCEPHHADLCDLCQRSAAMLAELDGLANRLGGQGSTSSGRDTEDTMPKQSLPDMNGRVGRVTVTEHRLHVDLVDGRTISTPLAWYPRLLSATPAQRNNWEVIGGGVGIRWPDIDEDLSVDGMLRGAPSAERWR